MAAASRTTRCKVVLIEYDITRLNVDAVVNFERTPDLTGGRYLSQIERSVVLGELHKLIHKAAGPGLKAECKAKVKPRPVLDGGDVLLTGAHNIYHAKGTRKGRAETKFLFALFDLC